MPCSTQYSGDSSSTINHVTKPFTGTLSSEGQGWSWSSS